MESKDIIERGKILQKAYSDNENAAVLRILKELKDGVVAEANLLRSTKIGITVNRVKSSKDSQVQHLAADIIRKWRNDVKPTGSPNGKKSSSGTASPQPQSTTNSSTPDPKNRSWKVDHVEIKKTDEPARNSCIGLLYDGLAHGTTTSSERVLAVAVAIEAAALSTHGPASREAYRAKMRSLFQNLKHTAQLRANVQSGDIRPERLVVMADKELKSAEQRDEDAKIQAENMRAASTPKEAKAVSSSLVCGKCKQKKVSYTQAQTRSADEPMTTFCECTICGNRWKVGFGYGYPFYGTLRGCADWMHSFVEQSRFENTSLLLGSCTIGVPCV